jgi:aryl-alcohol dehydrogenase-like predicted oxidoreductase
MTQQKQDQAIPAAREGQAKGAKRARRAYLSADERKQQILRAAQEAFSKSSLHGVSTRDIAKAADINPATLFEHFGSKEALFREAVIAPLFEGLREMKSRATLYHAAASDLQDLARSGVQKQIGTMKRLFPLITTALFSDLETGKALYREQFIPFIEERANLMHGLAKPETDTYFLELAAVGMLFFIAMDETFGDGRLSRATAAEQIIRLITFGTAPRPHEASSTRHPLPGSLLHDLRRLGPSDLMISPLGLEAVDFAGIARSASVERLEELLDLYLSSGGNFVEITNHFADEAMERLVAGLIGGRREDMVLAFNHRLMGSSAQPRRGGTYRFRLIQSVEESLRRCGTDYIDLLYLSGLEHGVHPSEVIEACDDLIRDGKIRYAGFSDIPAWQISQLQTLADARGKSPFVAIRATYGIANRAAERDLLPLAYEMGLGVTTCPPIEFGASSAPQESSSTRLYQAFEAIAAQLGKTPPQVALAWKFLHPGIVSALVHPHEPDQLAGSIAALQIEFDAEQIERLDSVIRETFA